MEICNKQDDVKIRDLKIRFNRRAIIIITTVDHRGWDPMSIIEDRSTRKNISIRFTNSSNCILTPFINLVGSYSLSPTQ